jgi:hypothetical protein
VTSALLVEEVTDKQQYYRYIVTSALLVEEVPDKQQYYRYIMTVSFIGGGSH